MTKAKKDSQFLGIKKKAPIGNRVVLRKSKMKTFISYLQIEVTPKIKTMKKVELAQHVVAEQSLSVVIHREDLFCFEELEQNSLLFKNLPALNITFIFNKKIKESEKILLLKTLYLYRK